MGAGDVSMVGPEVLEALRARDDAGDRPAVGPPRPATPTGEPHRLRAPGTARRRAGRRGGGPAAGERRPPRAAGPRGARRRAARPAAPAARSRSSLLGAVVALAWLLSARPLLAVRTVQRRRRRDACPPRRCRRPPAIAEGTPLLRVDVAAAARPGGAGCRRWPRRGHPRLAATRGHHRRRADAAWPWSGGRAPLPGGRRGRAVRHDHRRAAGRRGAARGGDPGPGDPATEAGARPRSRRCPRDVRDAGRPGHRRRRRRTSRCAWHDGTDVRWGDGSDSPSARRRCSPRCSSRSRAARLEPAGTIDVSAPDAVVLR